MSSALLRALVVGDRFIGAGLFADRLRTAAAERNLPMDIAELQLNYPAVASVPLPAPPAPPWRPLWEDPAEVVARAPADDAADPAIREYTGPVDLLAPYLEDVDALVV